MNPARFNISLRDVHFYARHGVFPQENTVGNEFILNLSVAYEYPADEVSDDLHDTISYAQLYEIARREMMIQSKLLEHVAWRIAAAVRSSFPFVESIVVEIEKVAPPIPGLNGSAAVKLTL